MICGLVFVFYPTREQPHLIASIRRFLSIANGELGVFHVLYLLGLGGVHYLHDDLGRGQRTKG